MRASLFSLLVSFVVGEEEAILLQTSSVRHTILTNGLQHNPSIEIEKYVNDARAAEALIQRAVEGGTSQTVAANFMALPKEEQERLIEFGRTSPEAHEVFARLSPARQAALLAVERHLDPTVLEKDRNRFGPEGAKVTSISNYRKPNKKMRTVLPLKYTVCNGLSNQMLSHTSNIAYAIGRGIPVSIPDAYILNGVQTKKDDRLLEATPGNSRYTKLSNIFDTDHLINVIQSFGITATLIPYSDATHGKLKCSWIERLRDTDSQIAGKIIKAFVVGPILGKFVDMTRDLLQDERAVCVHHRNGDDWKVHCDLWEAETGNDNCMSAPGHMLASDVERRLLHAHGSDAPKPTIFYVGDHSPPLSMKLFRVVTRNQILAKYVKVGSVASQAQFGKRKRRKGPLDFRVLSKILSHHDDPCPVARFRDLCAVVDFFVCSSLKSFVGNSVSTWSALQIARRHAMASWYNSGFVPLADILKVYSMPIVYTYTEESAATGKLMLMTSILSAVRHVPDSVIHVLYHGYKDHVFRRWLDQHSVTVHQHEPAWIPVMEEKRRHDLGTHLMLHPGNYLGTWQRIDIPQYVDAEYALYLDCDTVIVQPFTYADFGSKLPHSVAFSSESDETSRLPFNAGVALLNLPHLRETYDKFLQFITLSSHTEIYPFPADQGAYLAFYSETLQFLSNRFNMKPYWKDATFREPIVLHFHGPKPHDYLGLRWGIDCPTPAITEIRASATKNSFLCSSLKAFAVAMLSDEGDDKDKLLLDYCQAAFSSQNSTFVEGCAKFFKGKAKDEC